MCIRDSLWGMDRIPATLPGGRGRYGTRSQLEHVSDIIHRTMCASGLNEDVYKRQTAGRSTSA